MRNEIVLDLETKDAPGNWGQGDLESLGVSVVGTWSSQANGFKIFRESEIKTGLGPVLKSADMVIGFFIRKFDLPVLKPYLDFDLAEIPTLDIFDDVTAKLGHRISLSSLAKATLGQDKSGHGLDAVRWYHEGKWEELEKYCLNDVRLTLDLYRYGQKHGHLLFESFVDRKTVSVPVSWGMPDEAEITALIEEARNKSLALEIEYISRENAGDGFLKKRKIEIKNVSPNEIEAYDHLRKEVRSFRIGRILSARILGEPAKERMTAQPLFS